MRGCTTETQMLRIYSTNRIHHTPFGVGVSQHPLAATRGRLRGEVVYVYEQALCTVKIRRLYSAFDYDNSKATGHTHRQSYRSTSYPFP